jgi:hypothetical protein
MRLLAAVAAITITVQSGVAAQDPSASPETGAADACSLLTADEVGSALGQAVTANPVSPEACTYGDPAVSLIGLTIATIGGTQAADLVEQARAAGATELVVGGAPAFQAALQPLDGGLVRSQIAVLTGADTAFVLSADAPEAVDVAAAAVGLSELAVSRLGPISPPPLPSPAASIAAASAAPASAAPSAPAASAAPATGIAASFPTTIGGSPLTVNVMSGREFLSQMIGFRPMEQRVSRALRRRDLGIGDLSFAQASTGNGSVIFAFQVDGERIAPLVPVLLESLSMERTGDEPRAEDVAGKEGVYEILSGSEGLAYESGDTLWLVFSFGEEQVEIFGQLP